MLFSRSFRHRGHDDPDPARWSLPPMFFAFLLDDLLDDNRCY
jgi:hypothetical protein